MRRLLAKLRAEFPQLRICLSGDSLFACGAGFQVAKDYKCDYIYVFKAGRMPALWQDFQGLLRLCPEQRVEWTTPQGVRQVYRWVNDLDYTDSDGREWTFNAIAVSGDEEGWKRNGVVVGDVAGGEPRHGGGGGDQRREANAGGRRTRGLTRRRTVA